MPVKKKKREVDLSWRPKPKAGARTGRDRFVPSERFGGQRMFGVLNAGIGDFHGCRPPPLWRIVYLIFGGDCFAANRPDSTKLKGTKLMTAQQRKLYEDTGVLLHVYNETSTPAERKVPTHPDSKKFRCVSATRHHSRRMHLPPLVQTQPKQLRRPAGTPIKRPHASPPRH